MDNRKRTLSLVLPAIFLDFVGFSIIFPLFPQLADWYLLSSPDDPILRLIFSAASFFGTGNGATDIVLFGGILGGLYALLQFIAAPLWGTLSDRVGRKPVLLITIAGLFLAYCLWVFSGAFWVFFLSRVFAGTMSGNISAATAAIADVSHSKKRSASMALVGMSIGLGFIIGPAIGGILSLLSLQTGTSTSAAFALNPFSIPAAASALFSLCNFILIAIAFRETLSVEKRRSSAPVLLSLFKKPPYRGVGRVTVINFLFLTGYGGMEFTLTFLAYERLQFTALQNGMMFVYAGCLIALFQGGIIRRIAPKVGEKQLALIGFFLLPFGFLIMAFAHSAVQLYVSLTVLSAAGAAIIPCLTALVSLYAPSNAQGNVLGIFRAYGSLARAVGPLSASLIYWHYGATALYVGGAFFVCIPLLATIVLPKPHTQPEAASVAA